MCVIFLFLVNQCYNCSFVSKGDVKAFLRRQFLFYSCLAIRHEKSIVGPIAGENTQIPSCPRGAGLPDTHSLGVAGLNMTNSAQRKLPCASVSQRGFVRKHSRENVVRPLVHFHF